MLSSTSGLVSASYSTVLVSLPTGSTSSIITTTPYTKSAHQAFQTQTIPDDLTFSGTIISTTPNSHSNIVFKFKSGASVTINGDTGEMTIEGGTLSDTTLEFWNEIKKYMLIELNNLNDMKRTNSQLTEDNETLQKSNRELEAIVDSLYNTIKLQSELLNKNV